MRYAIVGNGVAGVTAALTLRARDGDAEITLIGGESEYFFSRTALMYAFMDRMTRRELEPYERKSYREKRITRDFDWASNLDAGAHSVTLRSGASLSYDRLLIASGSAPRKAAWRGLENVREGAVSFVSLQDLDQCERLTSSTRRAVVAGGGLIGIELVECLRHHGKQVTFLVREPWYWPAALAAEESAMVSEHIRGHGVDVRLQEEVAEVLTDKDGRLRGVRSSLGNEFPCELLGIAIGVRPAVDWLRTVSTPPAMGAGITVDGSFATSLPDVFAAGDCAEIALPSERPFVEQLWYSAKRQGELAARSMLGDPIRYQRPVFYNSAKFFGIEYTTVGAMAGADDFFFRLPGRETSIRIVTQDGSVAGFNLLGSRWDHSVLERWIAERRSLTYVMTRLHEAQFDGEFDRLDLTMARAAFAERKK